MASRIFICCLNIQEGRVPRKICDLVNLSVPHLVKIFSDEVYNRSNLTLYGDKTQLLSVLDSISSYALDNFNINSRDRMKDELMHHHVGILDLIPIHPFSNCDLDDAADVARAVSNMLECKGIPTLLYGSAHSDRKSLVQVRKETSFFARGQNEYNSDVRAGHDKLGISVVGSTEYVMSFNMVVNSENLSDINSTVVPKLRNREGGVQVMAYRNTYNGSNIVEIACNLMKCFSPTGNPHFVLQRTKQVVASLGYAVIHSYSTNPNFHDINMFISLNKK